MTTIKQELVRLPSVTVDGVPMFPGNTLLTWVKMPYMPWQLLRMEEQEDDQPD